MFSDDPSAIRMTQTAQHPIISNLNYCAKLTHPIDLADLSRKWIDTPFKYTLQPITRILMHSGNGVAINISPEGSIVILGKISPENAQTLMYDLVKRIGFYLGKVIDLIQPPRVASLMASAKLPFKIDMGELMSKISKCTRCKRNPGIWWKIDKFGVKTVGVFSSGSLMLCGAQSLRDL